MKFSCQLFVSVSWQLVYSNSAISLSTIRWATHSPFQSTKINGVFCEQSKNKSISVHVIIGFYQFLSFIISMPLAYALLLLNKGKSGNTHSVGHQALICSALSSCLCVDWFGILEWTSLAHQICQHLPAESGMAKEPVFFPSCIDVTIADRWLFFGRLAYNTHR